MMGGYESARRWNDHFNERAKRAAEQAVAAIDERADAIRTEFVQGADWGDYYDWMKANLPGLQSDLYHYSSGSPYRSSAVFRHFQQITGVRP